MHDMCVGRHRFRALIKSSDARRMPVPISHCNYRVALEEQKEARLVTCHACKNVCRLLCKYTRKSTFRWQISKRSKGTRSYLQPLFVDADARFACELIDVGDLA